MEFSKKIIIAVSLSASIIAIFSCVMIWITKDLSPLSYLIPSIFAELGIGTGFYYNKAKAENQIKLKSTFGELANDIEDDNSTYNMHI